MKVNAILLLFFLTLVSCWGDLEDPVTEPAKGTFSDISMPADTTIISDSCSVTWTAQGAVEGYELQLNDGAWSALQKTSALDTLLADGEYTLAIRIKSKGTYSDTIAVTFTIANLEMPAGFLSPRIQDVSDVEAVTLELYGKSTTAFSAFSAQLADFTIDTVLSSREFLGQLFYTDSTVEGLAPPGSDTLSGQILLCTIVGNAVGTADAESILSVPLSAMKLTDISTDGASTTLDIDNLQGASLSLSSGATE